MFLSIQLYGYDIGLCMSYPKKYQLSMWQCEWKLVHMWRYNERGRWLKTNYIHYMVTIFINWRLWKVSKSNLLIVWDALLWTWGTLVTNFLHIHAWGVYIFLNIISIYIIIKTCTKHNIMKSLISLQIMKKSPVNEYSDDSIDIIKWITGWDPIGMKLFA